MHQHKDFCRRLAGREFCWQTHCTYLILGVISFLLKYFVSVSSELTAQHCIIPGGVERGRKLSLFSIPIRHRRHHDRLHPYAAGGAAPSSPPSPATTTFFFSKSVASDPSWCIDIKISQPPTNSLSTYSCGMVGHSEYSLIPAYRQRHSNPPRLYAGKQPQHHIPCLSSWSSSTLNATNFAGSTPCMPRICTLARE